ncbi:MAG: hypothetical protein K6L81_02545 [Agarilytica sp.]
MKLNIPKVLLTMADYQLRAWGEHMRLVWAPDNGIQMASFYRTYGSLSDFREEDMTKLVEFMRRVRESHRDLYDVAVINYEKQVPASLETCELKRRKRRDQLRRLKLLVVKELYPAKLARHTDEHMEKLSCANI